MSPTKDDFLLYNKLNHFRCTQTRIQSKFFCDIIKKYLEGVFDMSDYIRRYTLRMNKTMLEKMAWIAQAEGRTVNKQFAYLAGKCIDEYEKTYGVITEEDCREEG